MGAPRKAFYPWLMEMPTLTPEARQFIEDEAQRRLSAGTDAIVKGEANLHHAMAAKDPAALQDAAAGLREALENVESGAAALRVLKEGADPRQIALAWFRGQTGLAPPEPAPTPGPFGWSWYHLTAMVFLGAFVLGTLLIQLARMRRVAELTARLANRTSGATAPALPSPPLIPASAAIPRHRHLRRRDQTCRPAAPRTMLKRLKPWRKPRRRWRARAAGQVPCGSPRSFRKRTM